MGNKKIWAYGKNSSNEYIKDSIGRNRMFFIWEALKMRRQNPFEYKKISFWSTQNNLNDRKKMTTVKTGFFRYIENNNGNVFSGDGESLSHSVAILAISKLDELNFTIDNHKLKIIPSEISIDNLKVQFENGNYYYPDLICKYDYPKNLIEKWGNKIAIEVKVNHACENIKIKDFEEHNYPIIEITLNKNMQFLKELKKEQFDETDLEKYYNFILNKFSNNIFGKLLSNPVRAEYHNRTVRELYTENKKLEILNQKLKNEMNVMTNNNELQIQSLVRDLRRIKEENHLLTKENTYLKNKSFFTKLRDLF